MITADIGIELYAADRTAE